ncbi:MAG TPA: hypothetical protein VKD91_23015 [Pyrinomonadaceae bacterium]|nr:hypothetical protein [Pyrinomonadaceae bacterium]
MNCHTFADLVCDLARDQMMDAATRGQALAHAGDCATCAAGLDAQLQLTASFQDLAAAASDQTASPVVWEKLSAAFDVRRVTPVGANRRRRIYVAGAIAAMLILVFALALLVRIQQQSTRAPGSIANADVPGPQIQVGEATLNPVTVPVNKKSQAARHRHSSGRQPLTAPVIQPKEIATDFIPLTYGSTEVGPDAQVVRVELPRSAMAGFGLPVNMDRTDQRVKADVLLSADGLARAIRFVQ